MKYRPFILAGLILLSITAVVFSYCIKKSPNFDIVKKSRNTVVYFPKERFDLGIIDSNKSIEVKIPFENRGENKLVIYDIVPSCGCIIPRWPLKPISPGVKENLLVTFTSSSAGYFDKLFTVFANNEQGPIIIHITGNSK